MPLGSVGPDRDLACPVAGGEKLTLRGGVPPAGAAPVVPGQVLGRAVLCLDGVEAASADLVALTPAPMDQEPEEKGFFARLTGG